MVRFQGLQSSWHARDQSAQGRACRADLLGSLPHSICQMELPGSAMQQGGLKLVGILRQLHRHEGCHELVPALRRAGPFW